MSAYEAPFIIEVIVVFLLTLYLLHQYGNWRKQHILVTVAVFVAWYFSFLIVFVVPLDVSAVSVIFFFDLSRFFQGCVNTLMSEYCMFFLSSQIWDIIYICHSWKFSILFIFTGLDVLQAVSKRPWLERNFTDKHHNS